MKTIERISREGWTPPWVVRQSLARHRWVAPRAEYTRVLYAASGNCHGVEMILAGGAKKVDCLDIELGALREGRANLNAPEIELILGDVKRIPFADHTYDIYISFETIEHVDDRAFLSEVTRVLKPGGVFVCSTPNRMVTNPGISLHDRPFNPFHLREYSLHELNRLLSNYFASVRFLGQTFYHGGYIRFLTNLGTRAPGAARRLHQAVKVLKAPLDRLDRHYPRTIPCDMVPEGLLAICLTHAHSEVDNGCPSRKVIPS